MASDDLEVVVLADREGNLYALPREELDRARVSIAHRDEVLELADLDVSGLAFEALSPPVSGVSLSVVTIGSFTVASNSALAPRITEGWGQ